MNAFVNMMHFGCPLVETKHYNQENRKHTSKVEQKCRKPEIKAWKATNQAMATKALPRKQKQWTRRNNMSQEDKKQESEEKQEKS